MRLGCSKGPDLLLGTVVRQTDFDVTTRQCFVSDTNLACAIFIRHGTLFDGEAEICLLPWQLFIMFCPTAVRQCLLNSKPRYLDPFF